MICAEPSIAIPSNRVRVVCGFGVTMASLRPTRRLSKVDLPAFGAPIRATWPHRVGLAGASSTVSGCVLFCPVDNLGMGSEPHPLARLRVTDDFLEDPDPRAVADNVWMHGQLENAALVISGIKLAPENIEHVGRRRIRPQRRKPVHHEIDRVVAYPFDWKLDDPCRLAVEQQFVAILVTHQRGIIKQPHLLLDLQGVLTEVPRRRAQADRPYAGDLFKGIGRTPHQVAFGLVGQARVQLMDPAMDPDFMTFGHYPALLLGMETCRYRRHGERTLDVVFAEQVENPRDADPVAELAPGQAPNRLAAIAQVAG